MNKTFTEKEFNDLMSSAIAELADEASSKDCGNAALGLMMSGVLVVSKIKAKIFEDNTETITIEKE